tara:strand:- start:283 stop:486 length:204 start_codon:yes stop_codon:yes gene_type:complete
MSRAEDGRLKRDVIKFLKRHKKLPSLPVMRENLAVWFDEKIMQRITTSISGHLSEFNSESFDRSETL